MHRVFTGRDVILEVFKKWGGGIYIILILRGVLSTPFLTLMTVDKIMNEIYIYKSPNILNKTTP